MNPLQSDTSHDADNVSIKQSTAQRRSFPATAHFAVLVAFALPVALLPYLLARRQLSLLRQQVRELNNNVMILQQDVNRSMSETATRKDEHRRIRTLLHEMMQETDKLRLHIEQNETGRTASDATVRSDLRQLLDERQHTRTQVDILRALGTSLADVAAFMHQIELEMGLQTRGKDERGVERLRRLALRMQKDLPSLG